MAQYALEEMMGSIGRVWSEIKKREMHVKQKEVEQNEVTELLSKEKEATEVALQNVEELANLYATRIATFNERKQELDEREEELRRRAKEVAEKESDLLDVEQRIHRKYTKLRASLSAREHHIRQREAAVVELRGLVLPATTLDESAAEVLTLQKRNLAAAQVRLNTRLRRLTQREAEHERRSQRLNLGARWSVPKLLDITIPRSRPPLLITDTPSCLSPFVRLSLAHYTPVELEALLSKISPVLSISHGTTVWACMTSSKGARQVCATYPGATILSPYSVESPPSSSVLVTNIPKQADYDTCKWLHAVFSTAGTVQDVYSFACDDTSDYCGVVSFGTVNEALSAIKQLDSAAVDSRGGSISVTMCGWPINLTLSTKCESMLSCQAVSLEAPASSSPTNQLRFSYLPADADLDKLEQVLLAHSAFQWVWESVSTYNRRGVAIMQSAAAAVGCLYDAQHMRLSKSDTEARVIVTFTNEEPIPCDECQADVSGVWHITTIGVGKAKGESQYAITIEQEEYGNLIGSVLGEDAEGDVPAFGRYDMLRQSAELGVAWRRNPDSIRTALFMEGAGRDPLGVWTMKGSFYNTYDSTSGDIYAHVALQSGWQTQKEMLVIASTSAALRTARGAAGRGEGGGEEDEESGALDEVGECIRKIRGLFANADLAVDGDVGECISGDMVSEIQERFKAVLDAAEGECSCGGMVDIAGSSDSLSSRGSDSDIEGNVGVVADMTGWWHVTSLMNFFLYLEKEEGGVTRYTGHIRHKPYCSVSGRLQVQGTLVVDVTVNEEQRLTLTVQTQEDSTQLHGQVVLHAEESGRKTGPLLMSRVSSCPPALLQPPTAHLTPLTDDFEPIKTVEWTSTIVSSTDKAIAWSFDPSKVLNDPKRSKKKKKKKKKK